MTTIMIVLHAVAAILFLGPVTVATSTFQVRALAAHKGDEHAKGAAKNLNKITNTYGVLSLLVPLLGLAIMFLDTSYFSDGRFHISIALAVVAWAILLFLIIPRQKKMMGALGLLEADEQAEKEWTIDNWDKAKGQLSMFGGIFALLWVIMAVLMLIPAWS